MEMAADNIENIAVESFYRDVLGEFSTYKNVTTKGSCAHWLVPTPTVHSDVSTSCPPFDSKFKFKVCSPRPFMPPANINPKSFKEGDPLELILKEKEKWESDLDVLIRKARKGKKWADSLNHGLSTGKIRKKDADKPLYTVNTYLNVAKHVDKDPHPNFSGNYNWLATGGCINTCTVNGDSFLLFPCGKYMDTLRVNGVKQKGEQICESEIKTTVPLAKKQRIYQLVAKHQGTNGIVGIRQMKTCSIVRVRCGSSKPLTARSLLEIEEKDGFFTSIDMNCKQDDKFCTLDSDHILKVWDLNTSSCISHGEIPSSEYKHNKSAWGLAKFSNSSNVLFALNRSTIFVKDQRMQLSKNIQEFCPKALIDDCEEISLLVDSSDTPLVYIGTSHRLLSLDLRVGWLQRWTHLLQAPPMYGSIFYDRGKSEEIILLNSYIPDDAVAIVNKCDQKTPKSEAFPIGLPSLGDCLLLARTRGKCLSPSFSKRLEMATTGLTLLSAQSGQSFTSFKSTSIGDIFSQQFLCKTTEDNVTETYNIEEEISNDVNAFKMWEDAHNEICSKISPHLACPVSSCDTIFNCIKEPIGKNKDKESVIKKWHNSFPPRNEGSGITEPTNMSQLLYELGSYKDLMAKVLLGAWDPEGLTTEPESRQYVENWLDHVSNTSQCDEDEPCLSNSMTSFGTTGNDLGENVNMDGTLFKVPRTPAVLRKKIKRESCGF